MEVISNSISPVLSAALGFLRLSFQRVWVCAHQRPSACPGALHDRSCVQLLARRPRPGTCCAILHGWPAAACGVWAKAQTQGGGGPAYPEGTLLGVPLGCLQRWKDPRSCLCAGTCDICPHGSSFSSQRC